jgi:hypothetical protein
VAKRELGKLLKTDTVCDGGCGWADVLKKLRVVGEAVNMSGGCTVSVTATVTVGAADEVSVMVP